MKTRLIFLLPLLWLLIGCEDSEPAAKQVVADDQTQENKDKSDDLISDQEYQNHTQRTTEQPKTTNTFHKHTPTGSIYYD